MVLLSLIIIDVKKNHNKNKKLIIGILLSVIIGLSILLIPSYYAGWDRGEYYFEEKSEYLNCLTLSANINCNEVSLPVSTMSVEMVNFYLENKLSIFKEEKFNAENKNDIEEFKIIQEGSNMIFTAKGEIQKINEKNIHVNEKINVFNSMITIYGWMLSDKEETLDSVYLLVNSKPFLKYSEFYLTTNTGEILNSDKSGIKISFLSGYLDNGCHEISLIGIKDNQLFSTNKTYQLCNEEI